MADFTYVVNFKQGNESTTLRSDTLQQTANQFAGYDFSLTSGQTVYTSGDTFHSMASLAWFGASFLANGANVVMKAGLSGSIANTLSGTPVFTYTFTSGRQATAWVCSGPGPTPFTALSGTINHFSWTCTALNSGQTLSGSVRFGWNV